MFHEMLTHKETIEAMGAIYQKLAGGKKTINLPPKYCAFGLKWKPGRT